MDTLYDVVGYEGLYKINKNGEVWGCKRNKFLRQYNDPDGYFCLRLCKDNHTTHHRIHRLLAQVFIPNPENLPLTDHIDQNKINNILDNLRWASHSTNQQNKKKGKRNTSGYYNIGTTRHNNGEYWRISFEKDKQIVFSKCFKKDKYTLEEVVAIRDQKYIEFGIVKTD